MKYSNNYLFYPDNKALEKALEHYKCFLTDAENDADAPVAKLPVQDIFINTRGHYEQHRYSASVYENAKKVLTDRISKTSKSNNLDEWVSLHNSLGNVIAAIGQQTQDESLFKQAIDTFNCVFEEVSQENSAKNWAQTQFNLGTVTQSYGRLINSKALLKTSVDAYTNVLLEWTRKNEPLDWAITMHQLGAAFHAYGKLMTGNRTFQKSVVAYKNALAELDADETPLELAATHNNRGVVLQHLAESEQNQDRMGEAIRAFETALLVCMEQQQPFHLAVICRVNKATAGTVLATMRKDASLAEEMHDEFEIILMCLEGSLQPLCKIHCEQQLALCSTMMKEFSA